MMMMMTLVMVTMMMMMISAVHKLAGKLAAFVFFDVRELNLPQPNLFEPKVLNTKTKGQQITKRHL